MVEYIVKGGLQRLTTKDVLIIELLKNKSLEAVTDAAINDSDESSNSINTLKVTNFRFITS